jgi:hypothetical protein
MKKYLIILCCVVFIFAYTSSVNILKPQGENVSFRLTDGQNITGELLTVDDSVIFNGSDGLLYKIQKGKISNIHLFDYSLQKKKMVSMIPTILVSGGLAILGFHWDSPAQRVILGASALLQIAAIFSGDPKVNFSSPFLDKLKLYCRYPQGLTEEQWEDILRYNKQDDFKMIP